MSNFPNFQLLLSILKHNSVFWGSKAKIKQAIKSGSSSNLAIKRCIRLKLEPTLAGSQKQMTTSQN